jgi:AmiR/NasT family two-component response regulator
LPLKKIHDLVELMQICMSKDKDFSSLREEAEKAKEAIEKIRKFIRNKLSILC